MTAPFGEALAPGDFRRILRRDVCAYCKGVGGTLDHVVPRAHGGRDVASNWTGSCYGCNALKGTRRLWGFLLIPE